MSEALPASGTSPVPETAPVETSANAAPAAAPAHENPRVQERNKTPEQRAVDWAYTINHAVACATTDIGIMPGVGGAYAALKSRQPFTLKNIFREGSDYLKGEIIGDVVAVPLTVMTQRFCPGFMEALDHAVEPIAAPFFHYGAHHAALRYASKHGLDVNSKEVVDHAEATFRKEIDNLDKAIMWNVYSYPIGLVGQQLLGHEKNWATIAKGKLLGTAISNVLLIGGRALLPDKFEKFDRLDGKYVIRPVTRTLSGLIGIDSKTVDRMDAKADAEEQRENGSWRERVKQQDTAAVTAPSV